MAFNEDYVTELEAECAELRTLLHELMYAVESIEGFRDGDVDPWIDEAIVCLHKCNKAMGQL